MSEVKKKPSLHTVLTPQLLDLYEVNDAIVVIIDVFRATSTMATALYNGASKIIKWLKENSNKYSKDYKGQYYQEQQYFEELIVSIYLVYIPSGGAGVIYFYPTRHKYPHFTIPVDMNGKVHYTTTEIERDYDPNNWIYFANFLLKLGSSYIHLE